MWVILTQDMKISPIYVVCFLWGCIQCAIVLERHFFKNNFHSSKPNLSYVPDVWMNHRKFIQITPYVTCSLR
jgi:hypothetical protein